MRVRGALPLALLGAIVMGCSSPRPATPTAPTTTPELVPPVPSPAPPTVSAGRVTLAPAGGLGLLGATVFTFSAEGFASSDGGPLSYAWDFGDGTTGESRSMVTHVYQKAGRYNVQVTVSNEAGQTATGGALGLVVRGVAGRWRGYFPKPNALLLFQLAQYGSTVAGTGTYWTKKIAIEGHVSGQGDLTLRVDIQAGSGPMDPAYSFSIAAEGDETFETFTATLTGFRICPCGGTLVRQ